MHRQINKLKNITVMFGNTAPNHSLSLQPKQLRLFRCKYEKNKIFHCSKKNQNCGGHISYSPTDGALKCLGCVGWLVVRKFQNLFVCVFGFWSRSRHNLISHYTQPALCRKHDIKQGQGEREERYKKGGGKNLLNHQFLPDAKRCRPWALTLTQSCFIFSFSSPTI